MIQAHLTAERQLLVLLTQPNMFGWQLWVTMAEEEPEARECDKFLTICHKYLSISQPVDLQIAWDRIAAEYRDTFKDGKNGILPNFTNYMSTFHNNFLLQDTNLNCWIQFTFMKSRNLNFEGLFVASARWQWGEGQWVPASVFAINPRFKFQVLFWSHKSNLQIIHFYPSIHISYFLADPNRRTKTKKQLRRRLDQMKQLVSHRRYIVFSLWGEFNPTQNEIFFPMWQDLENLNIIKWLSSRYHA